MRREPGYGAGKRLRPATFAIFVAAALVLVAIVVVGGWFAFNLLISLMID